MELAIYIMARLPRNEKQTHRLNSRPQIWPTGLTLVITLTLNCQGQIWNLVYLMTKWSDCHETKNESIDRTLGLKCCRQFLPWSCSWPRTFTFVYSSDHTHGFDHEFSTSNILITISLEWEGWLTFNKSDLSRPFMVMTMTLWWPRWGAIIYRTVTDVTSDIFMPSGRLFLFWYV